MTAINNQFGLGGQSDHDYDFFIGKGKRKKAKAKRAIKRQARKALRAPAAQPRRVFSRRPVPAPAIVSPTPSPAPLAEETETQAPLPFPESEPSEEILNNEVPQETGSGEDEYEDSFLGLGKKAKEKRRMKNAEKKAGIERMKAETATIQSVATSTPTQNIATSPTELQTGPGENNPEKAKSNTTLILVVVGGVVLAGLGLFLMLKKSNPIPLPA